ncbi:hypothetical protein MTYP_00354 [Methylophilaceae bacterium]|nr:hypothetical protein MTYP_00354 [Methylophilaceae bacterium]
MRLFSALIAGLIFGVGLILSGMTDPAKVIGFLDVSGRWNPSLGLVMGGAILVAFPAFNHAKNHPKSLLGEPVQLPAERKIDRRLILGAMTFGIGWGLSGYCPGPALASLLTGGIEPLIFTLGMVIGTIIPVQIKKRSSKAR